MSASIQELFNISDQLAKNLEIPHKLAVPKMTKIVVNAGIGEWDDEKEAISIALRGDPTEEEQRMINELMYAFADFLGEQMELAGQQVREWIEQSLGNHWKCQYKRGYVF